MNKNAIIALAIGVLVVAGGVFAFISSNSDDSNSTNSSETNPSSDSASNPLGLDLASIDGSYRVTITNTANGSTNNVVTEIDTNGNTKSTITSNGANSSFIFVNNETYVENPSDGTWLKFPANDSATPVSANDLNVGYTKSDIDDLAGLNIVDQGTGPCSAGTCRVYSKTDEGGDSGTIKVDTKTNRLSDVELNSTDGGSIQMVYDYAADINITAPENYTEYKIPDVENLNIDALR